MLEIVKPQSLSVDFLFYMVGNFSLPNIELKLIPHGFKTIYRLNYSLYIPTDYTQYNSA